MLAASPALFPSAASAKPQQNNPAPVTKREGGESESQRQKEGGPGLEGGVKKSREVQFCRVTSGSYVMQVFPFLFASPRVLIQIA